MSAFADGPSPSRGEGDFFAFSERIVLNPAASLSSFQALEPSSHPGTLLLVIGFF
jgi:hypothetical protein